MALQLALALCLIAASVAFVVQPVLNGVDERDDDAWRAELEDAKQAKYRELRDAELDYRAGKLSEQEWRATDGELRREAMLILAKLDAGPQSG